MDVNGYLKKLAQKHAAGDATEHTHRPTLQALLESLLKGVQVTNEPKQLKNIGAPDYVLKRNNIPLGYIEAKQIGANLDAIQKTGQFKRYKQALGNLILTDYVEFRLFRGATSKLKIRLAEVKGAQLSAQPDNFESFTEMLRAFAAYESPTITSANDLAERMAEKARLLAAQIEDALTADEDKMSSAGNTLQAQLASFQKHLIRGLKPKEFSDIYAQTVAYGMFAARLHDDTLDTFTRQEAATLIPAANPFLRQFFQHIAGYELDERIRWIVDDLADIFRAADVWTLMADYGKSTQRNDSFLHFYETFLGEYDSKLRKSRGVYYTPEPVVHFIVNAVDEILKREFNLKKGLADTSKTKSGEHKVQILDPATGTGTFLASIVKHIHANYFAGQEGAWPEYVKRDLIPRLHGFEVLMASYAMAHTKLEMVLRETGCELDERLRIFLTNSLEEHHPDTGTLFAQWLATEAKEANYIKRDTPVMVVIGNPPYAVSSKNRGPWIQRLLRDYKHDLNEKKLNLDDDYIKFIRYGEHLIEETGEGILAYISNNSFLDGVTHRQMRKHLLERFDRIYVLNLHGDARKKETSPDGSADNNVFDIQQGVSINLFVKTSKKTTNAKVQYFDLYGLREKKYDFLWDTKFSKVSYRSVKRTRPYYFFSPKNFSHQKIYQKGFSIKALFDNYNSGIQTKRDTLAIAFTPSNALQVKRDILALDGEAIKAKYGLARDNGGWNVNAAKKDIAENESKILKISYRPFDIRNILYTSTTGGMLGRPRYKTMRHMLGGKNIGLLTSRSFAGTQFDRIFVTNLISDLHAASDQTYHFPLYLYPDEEQHTLNGVPDHEVNLNTEIFRSISDGLGESVEALELLDYIYAVLHAPSYRERYAEFLKIDFPRVPYPTDKKLFRKLVKLGSALRELHLFESTKLDTLITEYPKAGDNIVGKIEYKNQKVFINKDQFFADVPELAWNFYIGGYQPAQKWLKDRKGRKLTPNDIEHYQKIIVALFETNRLMQEIDKVIKF